MPAVEAGPGSVRWAWMVSILLLLSASAAWGTTLETRRGEPDLAGWCRLDWKAGCATGLRVLSGTGLTLIPEQSPPPSSVEISLKLIPSRSLLFVFESPSTIGKLSFSVDGLTVRTLPPPATGTWWVRLDELPDEGILRLELDNYCDRLTIRSISYGCSIAPFDCWRDCRELFYIGMIMGAVATLAAWWLVMR